LPEKRKRKTIGRKDVVSAMKRLAVDSGLRDSDVTRFLDRYAFDYGAMRLLENLEAAGHRLRQATNTIEYRSSRSRALQALRRLTRASKVLSIGCGQGLLEVKLATLGHRVHGVDSDLYSVRVARMLALEAGMANRCRFHRVRGERLPFDKGTFDAVIYSHSLHEIRNRRRTLRESCRVLRPGGLVFIFEDPRDLQGLSRLAREVSLTVTMRSVLYPGKDKENGLVAPVTQVVLMKKGVPTGLWRPKKS